jgi:shikimate dehydrogenase
MPDHNLFAVTGRPVLHSKSPWMFNEVFGAMNMAAAYVRLAADTAEEALFLFRQAGLGGLNVTAPFKHEIMSLLAEVAGEARQIDGVNTVVNEQGRLKGTNTDHLGVANALKAGGITVSDRACVVLGAGGAGRAAVFGLLQQGGRVVLVNRTFEKAAAAAAALGCRAEPLEHLPEILKSADILVSSLPAGVGVVRPEWLRPGLVVLDANYKSSRLIDTAAGRGCTVIKGEEWLLHQAVPAFHRFTGMPADVEAMRRGLRRHSWEAKKDTVSLVGFMGSGKSTVAEILARRLGWRLMDADARIEAQSGRSIGDIFAREGEAAFRSREKDLLNGILGSPPRHTVIAWGGGIVLDGQNRDMLKKHSLVVWLLAPPESNLHLIPPGSRPLLDTADSRQVARQIFFRRLGLYARSADLVVNSDARWHSVETIAEKINDEMDCTF